MKKSCGRFPVALFLWGGPALRGTRGTPSGGRGFPRPGAGRTKTRAFRPRARYFLFAQKVPKDAERGRGLRFPLPLSSPTLKKTNQGGRGPPIGCTPRGRPLVMLLPVYLVSQRPPGSAALLIILTLRRRRWNIYPRMPTVPIPQLPQLSLPRTRIVLAVINTASTRLHRYGRVIRRKIIHNNHLKFVLTMLSLSFIIIRCCHLVVNWLSKTFFVIYWCCQKGN